MAKVFSNLILDRPLKFFYDDKKFLTFSFLCWKFYGHWPGLTMALWVILHHSRTAFYFAASERDDTLGAYGAQLSIYIVLPETREREKEAEGCDYRICSTTRKGKIHP